MEKQESLQGVIEYFKNRTNGMSCPGRSFLRSGRLQMLEVTPQFRSGSAADHGYDGSDFLPAGSNYITCEFQKKHCRMMG